MNYYVFHFPHFLHLNYLCISFRNDDKVKYTISCSFPFLLRCKSL